MATEKPQRMQYQFQLKLPTKDLPAPEAANWFHLTRTNADVQLMIGYVDPLQAARLAQDAKMRQDKKLELAPEVTRRVMMSISGFLFLRQQVEEIFRKMEQTGVIETLPETNSQNHA